MDARYVSSARIYIHTYIHLCVRACLPHELPANTRALRTGQKVACEKVALGTERGQTDFIIRWHFLPLASLAVPGLALIPEAGDTVLCTLKVYTGQAIFGVETFSRAVSRRCSAPVG